MTPSQQVESEAEEIFPHYPSFSSTRERRQYTKSGRSTGNPTVSGTPGPRPRTIRVALAGCGVVGGGFVRLLHESSTAIAARYGVHFALTRVLVRDVDRDRQLPLDARLLTNDLDSFLAEDADVIIEAVGGHEPARTIAWSALKRGKKLVTANKELVASYGERLSALADENNTGLDFGAAVGGSAPVISTLRDLVGAATPLAVRGILNGTSNFVISLLERGIDLDAALASARECGLAELDCARDLDGRDAAAKLAIIAWITFGVPPIALDIRRTSLIPGAERLVRCSAATGGRVRVIAECVQLPRNQITAAVEPVIVAAESAFGLTKLEENRVEVDLGWSSPLSVSGPGAGSRPTAAALLSDLLRFSPPPNARGRGAAHFVSVPDPRAHQWLIAAKLDASSLKNAAARVGLTSALEGIEASDTFIITRPALWTHVARLVADLESSNANPCVARYQINHASENVQ